jgi:hypothetical protein
MPYFCSIQELREQQALDEAFDAAKFLQERLAGAAPLSSSRKRLAFLQFVPTARDLTPVGTHIPPLWTFNCWRDCTRQKRFCCSTTRKSLMFAIKQTFKPNPYRQLMRFSSSGSQANHAVLLTYLESKD